MNGAHVAFFDGELWVKTDPFKQSFVDDLKGSIPGRRRRWSPEFKLWHVDIDFADVVVALAIRHYGQWSQVEPGELGLGQSSGSSHRRASAAPALADPYRVLCVTPEAPPELVQAAYRILAKRNHPDRGGNHESMVAINSAYEQLQGRS